jgi:hypothetical protein
MQLRTQSFDRKEAKTKGCGRRSKKATRFSSVPTNRAICARFPRRTRRQVLAKRDRKTSNFPKITTANRGAKNDFRQATIFPLTEPKKP